MASRTHQRWSKEGWGPLFELPADVTARGWALLEKAGVPRGAWLVALHVRDIRWRGTTAGLQAIRNADTASYLLAIEEITRRGGFVIRMGDAETPPAAACERDRLWPERHALRLDGRFPSDAQPFRPGIGVRADLRSAALCRAFGPDALVAAGHAAMARTRYLHPEAGQAGGRRNLFDTERNAAGAGVLLPFAAPSRRRGGSRGRGQRSRADRIYEARGISALAKARE
jgi:hypothetical protein